MTTSTYLILAELAERIFTVSDLANFGVRTALSVGHHLVTYSPRADQTLSPDHPIEAFADKQPANDNNPVEDVAPVEAEPAIASAKSATQSELAEKTREMPGVQRILSREAFFLNVQPANAPKLAGRSRLKALHLDEPAPKSIQIASRPFTEEILAHKPRPQLKNDIAA